MRTLLLLLALALAPMASVADHLLWKTEHPGDLTGWTVHNLPAGSRLEAREGGVAIPCGADTYLVRTVQLEAERYPTLVVDISFLANPRGGDVAFYWSPLGGGMGSERAAPLGLQPGHDGLAYLDLSGHPQWKGAVGSIRLDPLQGPGQVVLRGIGLMTTPAPREAPRGPGPRIVEQGAPKPAATAPSIRPAHLLDGPPATPPVREWNFAARREAQGWKFIDGAGAATAASEKPVLFTAGGAVLVGVEIDPQFHMPDLDIRAEAARVLVVELEVKKLGARDPDARLGIYWHSEPQPAFRASRALSAPLQLGPGMQVIVVDLQDSPEWEGTVRGLRLDPTDNAPIEATIRRVAIH